MPRRSDGSKEAIIIWSDRPALELGGLQVQIRATCNALSALDLQPILIEPEPSLRHASPGCIESAHAYRRSEQAVARLAKSATAIYCARLYDRFALLQLAHLFRLASDLPVVLRCATTADAARVARALPRARPNAAVLFVHCLNQRSVDILRRLAVRDCVVPLLAFNSLPQPLPGCVAVTPREPRFFYCGRHAPSKNVETLAHAWKHAGQGRRLLMYGDRSLQHLALEKAGISYLGRYQLQVPFSTGDVVFIPSFREGHPNVLVEAFGAGAVVVGTAVPGVREHLEEGRGIGISKPFDLRALEDAVCRAVRLSHQTRATVGRRAFAYFLRNFMRDRPSGVVAIETALDYCRRTQAN